MKEYGFVRVGACVPKLFLGNPMENAKEIVKIIKEAAKKEIGILSFPELCITGYTCGDLFFSDSLLSSSLSALSFLLEETRKLSVLSIVGLPLKVGNQLFNVAVVFKYGEILGVVPKSYIPNYSEFYEKRWFASGEGLPIQDIFLCSSKVPFGQGLIFEDTENRDIRFGVELCEDLWGVSPPSNTLSLGGATMIFNLSSSNELVGKKEYRENLVKMQSSRCLSAYIYASSGVWESSSDLLFSGASMIFENGTMLAQNNRFSFESNLICADIDVCHLSRERIKNISYMGVLPKEEYCFIPVSVSSCSSLEREYKKYPFVPSLSNQEWLQEIIDIQSYALARRLIELNYPKCVIGMSGGLDSTLSFLICVSALEKLGKDASSILGITMPGFGTSDRTYQNAICLVKSYGASLKEISIKEASLLHMHDIGLASDDRSVTYENVQARERTKILMNISNMCGGIVIGTGDLSELALGWCTYNGDQMSMYSVNSSIPKTLVRHLVEHFRDNTIDSSIKSVLSDILETPISPELLPPSEYGKIEQQTESNIGPYVLHDFFLYYFLRYGDSFSKIEFLANYTFSDDFSAEEIHKWLRVFIQRFFSQQFKRNPMPDGIKVGSVSLSPRGDFRLPSEISYRAFLDELDHGVQKVLK